MAVVGSILTDNRFEVSMKSPKEKRSINVGFLSDTATDLKIKTFFNSLCDIEISKIKKCTVFQTSEVLGVVSQADFRDVYLTVSYIFNGKNIATNKFYLPRVPKAVQYDDILLQVKELFGQDAQIIGGSGF